MSVGLHLWPVKRDPDSQCVVASELRLEAGRSRLAHSRRVYVNHRAGDFEIRKAESRSGGDQFSARGDECATVINRTASFIAKQVRVNIADAKGPRPFQHKSFADLQLAKGEVAGAGIQNQINAVQGQCGSRTICHPRILADFKTDLDVADVEMNVADGNRRSIGRSEFITHTRRPGFEPTRFIMNAVARQKTFRRESSNPDRKSTRL